MPRLGLLTGGSDAPGLNAVIRAGVKTACHDFSCDLVGIRDGFDGLAGQGQWGRMVGVRGETIVDVPLSEAMAVPKRVDPQ